MSLGDYLAANNLLILIAVFLVVLASLLWFLRKPANRHPMEGERGRALDEERARGNAEDVVDVPDIRRP
jgi:hypothetical protein